MSIYQRIIIAYACEDSGSEPGVGYYWSKAIATAVEDRDVLLITRKNNDVSKLLEENRNIVLKGVDLPNNLLKIKKLIGARLYFLIWQFLVFSFLIKNYKLFKKAKIHQVTFTPMYYPPIFFILPFTFIWGPLGGGESYPIAYLKELKVRDRIKEILRQFIRFSIYINPLFYLGCIRSEKIICSTPESAKMIPKSFADKVVVELMVFDSDKSDYSRTRQKTIVIANRLIDWKATHLFVEAFAEFKTMCVTDYKLIIIGDGPYFERVKPFIDGESIVHYRRFSKREDMLDILKNASLFVSMSLRDSGAASLLEAMSYGIPFLVSSSGAHRVYLNTGVGYGFELENFSKDKNKIVSLLTEILNDESLLDEQSKKIIETYNSYFSESEKIKRIKSILV